MNEADQNHMEETEIDKVVLSRYNGRDTLYIISLPDSYPILHWLMIGHLEQVDIWCRVPLSWDEADDFIKNVPTLLDGYIATLSPRTITLVADHRRDPAVTHTYKTGNSDTPAVDALFELRDIFPGRVAGGILTQQEADLLTAYINSVYATN